MPFTDVKNVVDNGLRVEKLIGTSISAIVAKFVHMSQLRSSVNIVIDWSGVNTSLSGMKPSANRGIDVVSSSKSREGFSVEYAWGQ